MNSLIKETLFRISDIMCILKDFRLKGPEVCIFPCFCLVASVVSDSLQPHGLQPARLLCPWDHPRQEYRSRLPFPPPGGSS